MDLKIKRGAIKLEVKEIEQKLYKHTQIIERDGLQEICDAWFEYKRSKTKASEVIDEFGGGNHRESAHDTDSDDADQISKNIYDVEELTKIIKQKQAARKSNKPEATGKRKAGKKGNKDLEEAAKKQE